MFAQATGQNTGLVTHQATLNGNPWNGVVQYQFPWDVSVNKVSSLQLPYSSQVEAGQKTAPVNIAGPAGSVLASVTPSPSQTLAPGGSLTFTYNFVTQGTSTGAATTGGSVLGGLSLSSIPTWAWAAIGVGAFFFLRK